MMNKISIRIALEKFLTLLEFLINSQLDLKDKKEGILILKITILGPAKNILENISLRRISLLIDQFRIGPILKREC